MTKDVIGSRSVVGEPRKPLLNLTFANARTNTDEEPTGTVSSMKHPIDRRSRTLNVHICVLLFETKSGDGVPAGSNRLDRPGKDWRRVP
jgi:hypothetical protein